MGLNELVPIGGRPAGGKNGRRFERFAQVCQDFPDRPWLWWNAISRMSPPYPGRRGSVLAGLTFASLTAGGVAGQDIFPRLEMRPSGTLVKVADPS